MLDGNKQWDYSPSLLEGFTVRLISRDGFCLFNERMSHAASAASPGRHERCAQRQVSNGPENPYMGSPSPFILSCIDSLQSRPAQATPYSQRDAPPAT